MNKPFGRELFIDLYGCTGDLNSMSIGYKFLDDAVATLGMTKQSPPFCFVSPMEYPDKAGLSGWVPLIESGIQIHTLVPKGFVTLDFYTCGVLDENMAQKLLKLAKEAFGWEKEEHSIIERGVTYNN